MTKPLRTKAARARLLAAERVLINAWSYEPDKRFYMVLGARTAMFELGESAFDGEAYELLSIGLEQALACEFYGD
jgi:hypothetical protein